MCLKNLKYHFYLMFLMHQLYLKYHLILKCLIFLKFLMHQLYLKFLKNQMFYLNQMLHLYLKYL